MGDTIKALKALYVALGGTAADVANIVYIPDMINAIATVAGGGGSGLPAVTEDDNGKTLRVDEGEWAVVADQAITG